MKFIFIKIVILIFFSTLSVLSFELSKNIYQLNEYNLDLVEKIRKEAAMTIIKSASEDSTTVFDWSISYNQMNNAFLSNKAAVLCGDAAHYLMKKYTDLGYEAYVLNYGLSIYNSKPMFTHAIVLVALNHQGKVKYILQDSYLNWGSREDYFEILNKLKKNQLEKINIEINDHNYRKIIINNVDNETLERHNIIKESCNKIEINESKKIKFFFKDKKKDKYQGYICIGDDNYKNFIQKYSEEIHSISDFHTGNENYNKLKDTLAIAYNNFNRTNNKSTLDLLTLPFSVVGMNGYIDIDMINKSTNKQFSKIESFRETELLIKILRYNRLFD